MVWLIHGLKLEVKMEYWLMFRIGFYPTLFHPITNQSKICFRANARHFETNQSYKFYPSESKTNPGEFFKPFPFVRLLGSQFEQIQNQWRVSFQFVRIRASFKVQSERIRGLWIRGRFRKALIGVKADFGIKPIEFF